MNAPRRRFGTDRKTTILKRYLVDKVPISDLCDEYGIKPNQIYAWQKVLFDHAEAAFQEAGGRAASKVSQQEDKIARLENKLQQKNEVIAELMEENVREKNPLGNSERTLGSPRYPLAALRDRSSQEPTAAEPAVRDACGVGLSARWNLRVSGESL